MGLRRPKWKLRGVLPGVLQGVLLGLCWTLIRLRRFFFRDFWKYDSLRRIENFDFLLKIRLSLIFPFDLVIFEWLGVREENLFSLDS